jgi:hypothetical protein
MTAEHRSNWQCDPIADEDATAEVLRVSAPEFDPNNPCGGDLGATGGRRLIPQEKYLDAYIFSCRTVTFHISRTQH